MNDLTIHVKDVGVLYLVVALFTAILQALGIQHLANVNGDFITIGIFALEGAIRFSLGSSVVRSRAWRRS